MGKYRCNLSSILSEQGRMKKWLCDQTEINPGWMTKLIKGDSLPNAHHAQKIANALGVSVESVWPLE